MNLILDQGNTKLSIALFKENELVEKAQIPSAERQSILNTLLEERFTHARSIFSGVGETDLYKAVALHLTQPLQLLPTTRVPFISVYKTPNTWGMDRKALVMAAFCLYPKKNVLLIDAGTCITYDLLDSQGVHRGGAISPGLNMRLQAMHTGTRRLPLVSAKQVDLIGVSTETSLQTGAYHGFKFEIEGTIEAYKMRYPNMLTIITGGDAHFLADTTKNSIFAHPNLLLQGLNFILEYNA